MKKYKYAIESIHAVKDEAEPLLHQHYEEVCVFTDVIDLDPDWETYYRLEETNLLRIYTVREEDTGILKGYFVVLQAPSLHYKSDIFVANDLIFISKEIRKSKVGYNLIKFAEDDLRKLGVSVLTINTKTHLPFDSLLEGMGYYEQEKTYSKCFKRGE